MDGGMDYGIDNGCTAGGTHCVLDSFIPSFQISKNRHIDVDSKLM